MITKGIILNWPDAHYGLIHWLPMKIAIARKWRTLLIIAVGLLLFYKFVLPTMTRAHTYGGPGAHFFLIQLEAAKAAWERDHPGGVEWPTKKDLLPYLTSNTNRSFDQVISSRHGQIYIINRTGTPVYMYHPYTERLYNVSSNEWRPYLEMK